MLHASSTLTGRGGIVDWYGDYDDLEMFDLADVPDEPTPPVHQPCAVVPAPRRRTRRTPGLTGARPAGRREPSTAPVPARGPVRTALLLDLENACPGSRRRSHTARQLREIIDAAGDVEVVVAIAAHAVVARQQPVLDAVGICAVSVKAGPDAADKALMRQARKLAEAGITRFIVASGDHYFARVAELGELVVVHCPGRNVSNRLRNAASSVLVAS